MRKNYEFSDGKKNPFAKGMAAADRALAEVRRQAKKAVKKKGITREDVVRIVREGDSSKPKKPRQS